MLLFFDSVIWLKVGSHKPGNSKVSYLNLDCWMRELLKPRIESDANDCSPSGGSLHNWEVPCKMWKTLNRELGIYMVARLLTLESPFLSLWISVSYFCKKRDCLGCTNNILSTVLYSTQKTFYVTDSCNRHCSPGKVMASYLLCLLF
jgi:hypothetical protein